MHIINNNNQTPSIICIQQIESAKYELQKAKNELEIAIHNLQLRQNELNRLKQDYQQEINRFNSQQKVV